MVCPEMQRTVTITLRISFTASIRTVSQLLGGGYSIGKGRQTYMTV